MEIALAESNPDVKLLTQQTYGTSPKVPARDLQIESECSQRTAGSVRKRDVYPGHDRGLLLLFIF